jgi:hypothetical protein
MERKGEIAKILKMIKEIKAEGNLAATLGDFSGHLIGGIMRAAH